MRGPPRKISSKKKRRKFFSSFSRAPVCPFPSLPSCVRRSPGREITFCLCLSLCPSSSSFLFLRRMPPPERKEERGDERREGEGSIFTPPGGGRRKISPNVGWDMGLEGKLPLFSHGPKVAGNLRKTFLLTLQV